MRYELTDDEWAAIKPMLPNKSRGVPRVNDRRVLNGIFWVLRSGAPWRDLPDNFGPYTTCYNRFVRWRRAGVWAKIMSALAGAHDTAVQMIDTSVIRVHQHGACITRNKKQSMGRSRGGLTSKIYALVDTNGLPVRLALTAGEAHDNRLEGLYLFVAIDRTSKFVFAQLHEAANVKSAVGFLQALIEAVPYTIHIVLTDNGLQFGDMPSRRTGPTARYRLHMFDRICREHGIEHRLTKPNHPWTNGQVERMNRTLKEATVRRYHYETHQQLREHLEAFLNAYNFAKRLKTLRGLTPYEHICKAWADQPRRFRYDPTHLTSGLNT